METALFINLSAIQQNYEYISLLAGHRVAAVLKADGYGAGAARVAEVLVLSGCKNFFVTYLSEAISLRAAVEDGSDIYILHGVKHDDLEECYEKNLIPVINSLEQLAIFNEFSNAKGLKLPVAIHFDTGMNRFGMEEWEAKKLISHPALSAHCHIKCVISHLAVAEDENNPRNKEQLKKFISISTHFPGSIKSLANSSGVFLGKEYHFDLARVGAGLYGINPYANKANPLKNAVTLTSSILQIKTIKKGDYVGYGDIYKADRDMKIGIIPIGYADGIKRLASSSIYVIINNRKCKLLGNISMDLSVVDLSETDGASLGTEVELIGSQIDLDEAGRHHKTIGYEILTSLGKRYKRVYTYE